LRFSATAANITSDWLRTSMLALHVFSIQPLAGSRQSTGRRWRAFWTAATAGIIRAS
jgi:hypothetical protein